MNKIEVTSKTQRIVVGSNKAVSVVKAGPVGPAGLPGPQGASGKSSSDRYYGEGPPGVIIGAAPGDEYVDALTGDVYRLE